MRMFLIAVNEPNGTSAVTGRLVSIATETIQKEAQRSDRKTNLFQDAPAATKQTTKYIYIFHFIIIALP